MTHPYKFKKKDVDLKKIKSSLCWRCYAKACNEWRGSSPRLSAWATQAPKKRRNGGEPQATLCRFDRVGNRIQTYRTDSVRVTTELTSRYVCLPTV